MLKNSEELTRWRQPSLEISARHPQMKIKLSTLHKRHESWPNQTQEKLMDRNFVTSSGGTSQETTREGVEWLVHV